jgi:hypothetical protein
MLNVVVRKFKLDKNKGEGIREIGNLIKGESACGGRECHKNCIEEGDDG